jgi:Tfp pilus assembly protein PilX
VKRASLARFKYKWRTDRGFALATVLIASTIMLTVLVVSVQSTAAIRTSLQNQYYNQLGRTAAESGINFAESCLKNAPTAQVPQWSAGAPLMANTGCDGSVVTPCNASANSAACTVASNGDVVSNFSVAYPTLDTNATSPTYGQATTVTSTGIVYILRSSQIGTNNPPWRTYKLTITANLVALNECSAYNPATGGWTNAVATTTTITFPDTTATPISLSASYINPGPMYFRKDFTISTAGTYTIDTDADDRAEVSVDGKLVLTDLYGTTAGTTTVALTPGCHNVVVKVTNRNITANASMLDFALKLGTATPVIVSDTTWRAIAGNTYDFSTPQYYADSAAWTPIADLGGYAATSVYGAGPTNWLSQSQDSYANWISTPAGNTSNSSTYGYPFNEYTAFRTSVPLVLATATSVILSASCDNSCNVYLDGVLEFYNAYSATTSVTITIPAGSHTFGVALYNGGTSANASAFVFGAVRASDGVVLTSSDESWQTTDAWSSTFSDPQSYDNTFVPSTLPTSTASGSVVTNLITNPGFEVSGTTNVQGTNVVFGQGGGWAANYGGYSLLENGNSSSSADAFVNIGLDAANGLQQGMTAGHTYVFSAVVDLQAPLTGTLSYRWAGLGLFYLSTAFGTYRDIVVHPPNLAGQYSISYTITLPADTTQAFVRLYNGSLTGGGPVYWDDVSLTDITSGPAPTAYHDGSSSGWKWNGTTGLSSSYGPYTP